MTREEASKLALEGINNSKCLILELGTGFGKSKQAIDCANIICDKVYANEEDRTDVLILVNTTPQKLNFEDEIKKWGGLKTDSITIECYASIHKYKNANFDIVIMDEAQHLSPKRAEILKSMNISYSVIALSATLPKRIKQFLQSIYTTTVIKSNIQESIDSGVLPDPTIYMMPLEFNNEIHDHVLVNKNKGLSPFYCNYNEWRKQRFNRQYEVHIKCTDAQYLRILDSWILDCKNKATSGSMSASIKWKRLCNDRLIFLSRCKDKLLLSLQDRFRNSRMLTFCASIEQAKLLGKNCIHSKNKQKTNLEVLKKFNDKKIKHLISVSMLNEGMNLTDCRIAVIGNINSSEIIIPQRIGRALRHKKPIIIIPYFTDTREQEILEDKLKDYNHELIKVARSINDIKLK